MDQNAESGVDMNSSSDMIDDFSLPERITTTRLTPRTLCYDDIDDDEVPAMIQRATTLIESNMNLESPPYRKIRTLRLFDSPATPKTLIKKSSFNNGPPTPEQNAADRPKAMIVQNKALESVTANINPFSPSSKCMIQMTKPNSKR